jgi:hypothetical protein
MAACLRQHLNNSTTTVAFFNEATRHYKTALRFLSILTTRPSARLFAFCLGVVKIDKKRRAVL